MRLEQAEREMERVVREETAFLRSNRVQLPQAWQEGLEKRIPPQLQKTLYGAFCQAFKMIFDGGTPLIEMTYAAKSIEEEFRIHQYAASIRSDKDAMKDLRKSVRKSQNINTLVSAAEGIGMGTLGLGLPDIPLLLSVILRTIYETALHYGFRYDTEAEQVFLLQLIEAALQRGDTLQERNAAINRLLYLDTPPTEERAIQIKRTSDALASELLCLKFLQGFPVVGIVGGISDVVYQKKIAVYAELKYRRRFLQKQIRTAQK